MAKLKLTYFDFHGGRGEPARLALSIGGIAFEDDRVQTSDWERRKGDTPFGALPVLEVDGQIVAQSNAINRYVGKLADLYPSDPWEAALCDEAMEAVEDITNKIAATLFLPEEQKKAQRKALVAQMMRAGLYRGKSAEQPLRQRSSFQPDPLEADRHCSGGRSESA
jgi:prostaglandin-H2 D-isomerase / glutathione transferase